MHHLPAATLARTGKRWGNEAALEPSCDHFFRTASFQLGHEHAVRNTSEVLRVALQDLELIAALVLALEDDLVASAADRLAVLVLVGILEADLLALERPLALGDLAAFHQGQRAVLAV